MVIELTPNEKRTLISLKKIQTAHPDKISADSGLKVEAAMQSVFMLEERGFVTVSEEIVITYSLTSEGVEYAASGLPERQIMSSITNAMPLDEIKKLVSPKLVGIALGWLKKKGWANIDQGVLLPAENGAPAKGSDELLIEKLAQAPAQDVDESVVKDLIKRNLVSANEEKIRTISITSEGVAVPDAELVVEDDIGQITSDHIRSGEWRGKTRNYNIHVKPQPVYGARIHPYQRLIDEMRQIFLEMGFTEIKGDIVQSSFWNFDALFQPQDHPAREMQDTFHLDSNITELPPVHKDIARMHECGGDLDSTGWGGKWSKDVAKTEVLRTHTTAVTIKYLSEHTEAPVKAFCIDRAYRRETIDPTHTPEFEQLEGVVMDVGMSFSNLLGCLTEFYHRMGFDNVRFRPAYFPYTEPSVEPEVYIEGMGWVELGGAGIFRKEVTDPLGIKHPVLAWGLGVSRVAMLKLGLKDLRELYQSDINWLRQEPVVSKMVQK